MKVAIAGSRKVPPGIAARFLTRFLVTLADRGDEVLLRCAADGTMQPFEFTVLQVCEAIVLQAWARPTKPQETPGRASVYRRDIELVNEADLTVLFVAEEDVEEGYSGTYHLFEKALDDQRPVYAWKVTAASAVDRWGEYDPENRFADLFE